MLDSDSEESEIEEEPAKKKSRKQSDMAWDEMKRLRNGRVKCKHCQKHLNVAYHRKVERVRKHLKDCHKFQKNEKVRHYNTLLLITYFF